jgi:thiamine transport system substrate-binding protein
MVVTRRSILAAVAVVVVSVACTGDARPSPPSQGEPAPVTLTLLTHDSFDASKSVLRAFEARTGITIEVVAAGDAGQLANRAILAAGNPEGDVLFGVDNNQLADVVGNGVFAPYVSPGLASIPVAYQLDPTNELTPVDHGEVCVNVDPSLYIGDTPPPSSLADLADPRYRGQLVVENPATSTPGLAFLLATIAAYGDPGFEEFWRGLRANDVTVVDGWEQAYFGEFSGAGGGEGTHPLVVSYATSPVAEVVFSDPPVSAAPTSVLTKTCVLQIEFAGILRGTEHEVAARQLIDFLVSRPFQQDIPLRMFVYPVSTAARLPTVFRRHAATIIDPFTVAPADVAAHRADWVARWAAAMGQ